MINKGKLFNKKGKIYIELYILSSPLLKFRLVRVKVSLVINTIFYINARWTNILHEDLYFFSYLRSSISEERK